MVLSSCAKATDPFAPKENPTGEARTDWAAALNGYDGGVKCQPGDREEGWRYAGSIHPARGRRRELRGFEGRPLERVTIAVDLAALCAEHCSRMPAQYWRDPLPRAREYLGRYPLPWESDQRQI